MHIETNIKRLEELAKQREEANWKFRSFLKGSDIPVGRIDRVVHEFYREVAGQVDCTQCANCCKVMRPVLKPADIKRLARRFLMPVAEFRSQYLKKEEDGEGLVFKTMPCPFLKDNACTVYDERPRDCRSYPHLHKRNFVFRTMGVVSNCSICPIVFTVYEHLKREFWHSWSRDR